MDEVTEEGAPAVQTVGERLREAREARGISLEDIAAQTRIPVRHLTSLETSDWARLPAPTYSIGFAKNYAGAVGLDKAEIVDQLRYEMGGYRPASALAADAFEPVDPKRQMPKGLVFGALGVLLLVIIGLSWLSNRQLDQGGDQAPAATDNAAVPVAAPPAATPVAAAVTIAATAPAWVEIRDGTVVLKQGELAAGESFALPPNAAAPTLTTAKPEALTIKVGNQVAPPVGPAGKKVESISLRAADLLKGPVATPAPAAAASPPAPRPEPKKPAAARRAPPAPAKTAPATAAATPPPAPVSNGVAIQN